ncbi:MAG: DUF1810 domain-containing protein [Sulfuritalea sp.]|nr:DUF1810 domain-containing protein [Polynucleobacter sp.]MCF8188911.1 DUF1810 domain-containing protein [Sulfuritalea sp.]
MQDTRANAVGEYLGLGGGVIKNKLVNVNSLERFVLAQEECYEDVLSELREGRKRTHWMWFVFPQLKGLGQSEYSEYFGLNGQDEARRYWDHPVLGYRYRECMELLLKTDVSVDQVLGKIDALKLLSSLNVLDFSVPNNDLLKKSIHKLLNGNKDDFTIHLLNQPT